MINLETANPAGHIVETSFASLNTTAKNSTTSRNEQPKVFKAKFLKQKLEFSKLDTNLLIAATKYIFFQAHLSLSMHQKLRRKSFLKYLSSTGSEKPASFTSNA